ncbi:MAG: hypothetical protein AAF215_06450 [Cyanobacteria bacterium P01_A01_bin.123]
MFSAKQTPPPPEPNGIELKIRVSESALATLTKLLVPIVLAGLVGSGIWDRTQSTQLPIGSPAEIEELVIPD